VRLLLANLLLALVWILLTAQPTVENFAGGFLIGLLVLSLVRSGGEFRRYTVRWWRSIAFVFYFLGEVVAANVRLLYFLLTPNRNMRSGIVRVPLDIESELGITLLANVLTLTPGTLALDVDTDRRALFVHAIYMKSPQDLVRSVKEGFERRLREILE